METEENTPSELDVMQSKDDEVSRAEKAIIIGLEEIICELKYNNSNIDELREEMRVLQEIVIEINNENEDFRDHVGIHLFKINDDSSSIRSMFFWVFILGPLIAFVIISIAISP